ncbi:MAG: hypothetical protein ACO3PI_02975 [Burkholderiaceae bacterium]
MNTRYAGFFEDAHGITQLGRVVLDAWVFGIIPREEDCKQWDLGRMQNLMQQVQEAWDAHGGLPSLLPPELGKEHAATYNWAMDRARSLGWSSTLGDDD